MALAVLVICAELRINAYDESVAPEVDVQVSVIVSPSVGVAVSAVRVGAEGVTAGYRNEGGVRNRSRRFYNVDSVCSESMFTFSMFLIFSSSVPFSNSTDWSLLKYVWMSMVKNSIISYIILQKYISGLVVEM